MKPGLFITFEGIDGTGKSTQLKRAIRFMRKHGHPVLVTREPGGTRVGEEIREIILASKNKHLAPAAELAMMYAARAQLLQERIRPALARGETVVSDRYNTASFAYQGYGRELGVAAVRAFDQVVCGSTQPDLTIILDLDPEEAQGRALGRGKRQSSKLDRIEEQGMAFHKRVRAGYLALARKNPQRIKVVRADQTIAEIERQIQALLGPLLVRTSKTKNSGKRKS
jgi:dTMP kinase